MPLIPVKVTKEMEIKTLKIAMKVSDSFACSLHDETGKEFCDYEGYVPHFMPKWDDGSSHYGDYLVLNIDLETGKILNWKTPTADELMDIIPEEKGGNRE